MFVRLADRLGRQDQHVEIIRQPREHGLDQALGDCGVGHHRKMRAVLLGRRDWQDCQRGIAIEPGKLARFELRPEPLGSHR
jgi:hypothetical protein